MVPGSNLGKQLLGPSAQDTSIPRGGSTGPTGLATSWAEAHALMTSQASPAPASRPQPPVLSRQQPEVPVPDRTKAGCPDSAASGLAS